ncbi:cytochrome c oxidase subunit 3 [Zhongshania aquimaris]|uniref:Cytochrome c oxidase subunit 3 n=1 Tax=Zhongshania aquimaris TaxID=2857107 RepID=A0ABS6VVX7_9GAMM|nr:cytochrome c oxidase subunit 3 [Zhongshania aquimaris]MBW2942484.1 cytochrome c oxidase subunit 3 [Zhongshania aquimaris]
MTSTNSPAVNLAKPASATSGRVSGESSMWFFIIGDLFIFGAYFVSYMYYRGQDQQLFLEGQQHLDQWIGVVNTLVLLTSSLFVALAAEGARNGNRKTALRMLTIACALGVLFPVLKMIEWLPKLDAGLTPGESLFFMYYYLMTGLHLVHVILGLIILGFVFRELKTAKHPNIGFVETGAVYWHMVDLLWLLLFALFYLMR